MHERRLLEDPGQESFNQLDKNGDAVLDLEEFRSVMGNFNPPLPTEQVEKSFDTFDTNHDKVVSLGEFIGDDHAGAGSGKVKAAEGETPVFPQSPPVFDGQAPLRFQTVAGESVPITLPNFMSRMTASTAQDAFLVLDENGDGFLEQKDLSGVAASEVFNPPLSAEEAEYAFKGLDVNHDDEVCVTEFFGTLRIGDFYQTEEALAAIGARIQSAPAVAAPAGGAAGADGAPGMPAIAPLTEAQLRARMVAETPEQAFNTIDSDHNNMVNLEEYAYHADAFNPPLSDKEVKYTFKGFDADSNNLVSSTEFFGSIKTGHFFQTPQALEEAVGAPEPVPAPVPAVPVPVPAPATPAPAPPGAVPVTQWVAPITEEQLVKQMRGSFSSPQQAFQAMDTSQDRQLDFNEYVNGVTSFTVPLDDIQAMYSFKGFDTEDDHRISYNEFFGALKLGDFFQTKAAIDAVSKTLGFDCSEGFEDWQFEWSEDKQKWCCEHKQRGCPVETTSLAAPAAPGTDTSSTPGVPAVPEAMPLGTMPPDLTVPPAAPQPTSSAPPESPYAPATAAPAGGPLTVDSLVQRMGQPSALPSDLFNALDLQKDGMLVADELMANKDAFTPPLQEDEALAAIKLFDTDLDNQVTLAEFTHGVEQQDGSGAATPLPVSTSAAEVWQPQRKAMTSGVFSERLHTLYGSPQDAFDQMDSDLDRCLTQQELANGTADFREPLTEQEVEYAFSGLDVNGDWKVCEGEFLGVLNLGRFFQSVESLKDAGFDVKAPTPHRNAPPHQKPGTKVVHSEVSTTQKESTTEITTATATTAATNAATTAPMTTATITTTEPPETTTTNAFEVVDQALSLDDFVKRMGSQVPPQLKVLEQADSGNCVDLQTFREAAGGFNPPLSPAEADYAFCGMDENHDRKVCSFEFLGTIKIGHFFPSRSDLEHLKEIGTSLALPGGNKATVPESQPSAGLTPALLATSTTAKPKDRLKAYRGVPSILSGHAEVTCHVANGGAGPTRKEEQEMSDIFKKALEHKLRVDINIADVESTHLKDAGNADDKTVMILWTAGAVDDGGALQSELHEKSARIKKQVEKAIAHLRLDSCGHPKLWTRASLSYYGPKAAALPKGSQLSEDIGHQASPKVQDK